MKRLVFTLFVLWILFVLAGFGLILTAKATPLYMTKEVGSVQYTCDPNTVPFEFDRKLIRGALLPAKIEKDNELIWEIPTGAYIRTAPYHYNKYLSAKIIASTCKATVSVSSTTKTWTLKSNDVPAGVHAFTIEFKSSVRSCTVTVLLLAIESEIVVE